jgi:hypothetical protein
LFSSAGTKTNGSDETEIQEEPEESEESSNSNIIFFILVDDSCRFIEVMKNDVGCIAVVNVCC